MDAIVKRLRIFRTVKFYSYQIVSVWPLVERQLHIRPLEGRKEAWKVLAAVMSVCYVKFRVQRLSSD